MKGNRRRRYKRWKDKVTTREGYSSSRPTKKTYFGTISTVSKYALAISKTFILMNGNIFRHFPIIHVEQFQTLFEFRENLSRTHSKHSKNMHVSLIQTSVWKPRLHALQRASILTASVIFSTIYITAAFILTFPIYTIHLQNIGARWALAIHEIMNLFQQGGLMNMIGSYYKP